MENIKNKYINSFLSKLTEKDKKSIYFNQFIWHAFSYEKIPCIEGINAIEEFKKIKKNNVYLFFQKNDLVLEMKNLTYDKLLKMINKNKIYPDCYVVDRNFEWTFVFTHETLDDCSAFGFENPCYIGPFFTSKKIIGN